uniref:Uncharacterized protein n=1 Tax=Globisporangium ultimum (strain ATCC 200006 / CBS 805.95 / DAOM BR144) TaxID=431595 RepID=K3WA58_GLOUD
MKLYVHYEGAATNGAAAEPSWTKRVTLTPSLTTLDDVLRVFCAAHAKKFPLQPALTLGTVDVLTERNHAVTARIRLQNDRNAQRWIAAVLLGEQGGEDRECDFELVVVRKCGSSMDDAQAHTQAPVQGARSAAKLSLSTGEQNHTNVAKDESRERSSQLRAFLDLGATQMQQRKYRSAKQLYETLVLPTEPRNTEALVAMGDIHAVNHRFKEAVTDWYTKCWQAHSKRPCKDKRTATLTFACGLKIVDCEIRRKRYGPALDMIERLQTFLRHESKCCGAFAISTSAAASTLSSTEKEDMEAQMDVRKAQALYEMHAAAPELQETAIALLTHLLPDLQAPEVNLDALLLYARIAHDRGKKSEALSMVLRVVVGRPNDKAVKKQLVTFLKGTKGIQRLQQVLPPDTKSSAAAYAFIGTILKEFGTIESSVACYEQTLRGNPSCASYALNHAHVLEVNNRYENAYKVLTSFFRQNGSLSVANGVLTAGAFLKALEIDGWESRNDTISGPMAPNTHEDEQWRIEWVSKSLPGYAKVYLNGNLHQELTKTRDCQSSLSEDELDLLACFFTMVKILFLNGRVSVLPRLISLLEPVRAGKELHRTNIRNEQAYYSCIAQLLSIQEGFAPPSRNPESSSPCQASMYVCGDSHTLATAWREITVGGQQMLLRPALVTGLKHWHLRKDSVFYPKINFWRVLERIPPRSKVVFLFGEIDCREGILVAVEKCKYETIEEGMEATIRIFMDVLADVVDKYEFKAFIHPVVPVLNETRQLVIQYNKILKKHALQSKQICTWLDFFDELVYDTPKKAGKWMMQSSRLGNHEVTG